MKIISLITDESLIKRVLAIDPKAEELLFNRHAPKMLSVCRSYISDLHYAEDVMVTGFTKAFQQLHKFRFDGSFKGWIRRIMIRESIDFLRSRKQLYFADVDEATLTHTAATESDYDAEMLQLLIDALPNGYKTVLILIAVECYNHKEIAEILGISESTSKSQLYKARRMINQQLTLNAKKNGI